MPIQGKSRPRPRLQGDGMIGLGGQKLRQQRLACFSLTGFHQHPSFEPVCFSAIGLQLANGEKVRLSCGPVDMATVDIRAPQVKIRVSRIFRDLPTEFFDL
jgi:hypothetical protein